MGRTLARSSVAGLCLVGALAMAGCASWIRPSYARPSSSSGNTLTSVSCPAVNACLAVGVTNPNGSPSPLAERWDGHTWILLPTLGISGALSPELDGVSCSSPDACTAVGTYITSSPSAYKGFAARWNGSGWAVQAIAAPTGLGGHAGSRPSRARGRIGVLPSASPTGPTGDSSSRPPSPSTGTAVPGQSKKRRAPTPTMCCAACHARCRTLAPRSAIRRTSSRLPRLHSRCDETGPRGSCSRRPPPATRYPPGSTECPARRSSCARPSAPPGQAPRLRLWSSAGATGSGRCSRSPSPTTGPSQLLGCLMFHANALLGRGRRALPPDRK